MALAAKAVRSLAERIEPEPAAVVGRQMVIVSAAAAARTDSATASVEMAGQMSADRTLAVLE